MKFLTMVTTSNPEQAGAPPPALMQALAENGAKAGPALRDTGGMRTVGTARVEAGDLLVDGPYAEAREAVGGFALYEVESEAAVLDVVRDFLELHRRHWPAWEGEVRILHLMNFGPPPA